MIVNTISSRINFTLSKRANSTPTPNTFQALTCDTVSFSPKINKKLGFSSQLLYKAQIKQFDEGGKEKYIPIKITRLIPTNEEDSEAVNAINSLWAGTRYTADIATNFKYNLRGDRFLALEIDDDKKTLENRILCLAEISSNYILDRNHKSVRVEYIQAAPCAKHGNSKKYKGSGEVLMYGICKYAKKLNFSEVTLKSTNHIFYNHIGMPKAPKIGRGYYAFKEDDIDKFTEKVEAKYDFNPD